MPASALTIAYDGSTTLNAGDTISLTIENTGGVDTTYSTVNCFLKDSMDKDILQQNLKGAILAGEKKTLTNITLPVQVSGGYYYLEANIKNDITGNKAFHRSNLKITSLAVNLEAITDKPTYMKSETITGLSNIINSQLEIPGGSLTLSVSKANPQGTGQFIHFLPKTGWTPEIVPLGIAIAPDGTI